MQSLPSPVGLLTFNVVASHLNFSRAGRDLHITQAAVSHRIRALEEEIGVKLFRRTSRRVELTPAGSALFKASRPAFEALRQGVGDAEAVGHPQRVTVSCSPSFAIRWLMPRLGALRHAVPGIEVHISAEDELVDPGGAIDVCIRFGAGGYRGVRVEQLTRETVTVVCTPLYLQTMKLRAPRDLSRCVLLHDDVLVHHALHVGWKEWLAAAEIPQRLAASGLHFSHSHLALDAASAGQGVALGRTSLVRSAIEDGRLVAPFDVALESALTYWLVSSKVRSGSSAVVAFQDWLREAAQ